MIVIAVTCSYMFNYVLHVIYDMFFWYNVIVMMAFIMFLCGILAIVGVVHNYVYAKCRLISAARNSHIQSRVVKVLSLNAKNCMGMCERGYEPHYFSIPIFNFED